MKLLDAAWPASSTVAEAPIWKVFETLFWSSSLLVTDTDDPNDDDAVLATSTLYEAPADTEKLALGVLYASKVGLTTTPTWNALLAPRGTNPSRTASAVALTEKSFSGKKFKWNADACELT